MVLFWRLGKLKGIKKFLFKDLVMILNFMCLRRDGFPSRFIIAFKISNLELPRGAFIWETYQTCSFQGGLNKFPVLLFSQGKWRAAGKIFVKRHNQRPTINLCKSMYFLLWLINFVCISLLLSKYFVISLFCWHLAAVEKNLRLSKIAFQVCFSLVDPRPEEILKKH